MKSTQRNHLGVDGTGQEFRNDLQTPLQSDEDVINFRDNLLSILLGVGQVPEEQEDQVPEFEFSKVVSPDLVILNQFLESF